VTDELPQLIAFDLDDTLAPSKARIPDQMLHLLQRLLNITQVAVISGGAIEQFTKQLLEPLSELTDPSMSETQLERLHVLPTCGTHYEIRSNGQWQTIYREVLTPQEQDAALQALRNEARRLGLWESHPWGEIIENRGSQVTFSALGQRAPLAAKQAWDPDGSKKSSLRDAVAAQLPSLEVRSGGSTSVDITRKGIDKAYGMQKLIAQTGISKHNMLFVGDRLDPSGNDYPVKAMGMPCHAVSGWEDTAQFLMRTLEKL
jgi:phosphomannomutase